MATKIPQSGTMTAKSKSATPAMKTGTSAKQSATAMKASPAKSSAAAMKAGAKTPNSKTEFAQDMTKLDDVALISDTLSSQKNLIKMYSNALCEVSDANLRKVVAKSMTECANDQFDAFLYMNQRNQYPTEPAQTQKVNQAKQKFAQKSTKMKK